MDIIKAIATQNPCYKKATPMKPVGIVVHSTGVNNPYLKRYVNCPSEVGTNTNKNYWDRSDCNVCVHGFIGYDKDKKVRVAQILPYDYACWGVGGGTKGSYNYDPVGHIQFEMCEDGLTNKTYCKAVYDKAVEYAAYLCKEFNFDPKGKDVIVSHEEAYKLGYGSRHTDPTNWWGKFGFTMDQFRNDVAKKLQPAPTPVKPQDGKSGLLAGMKLNLKNVPLYSSQTATSTTVNKTGTYYTYDDKLYGTRVAVTNKPENVGKKISGFIELEAARASVDGANLDNTVQMPANMPKTIKTTYQVRDASKKKWLANVVDATTYAGNINDYIDAILISLDYGDVYYQVHTMNGVWLPEVTNRQNYAGNYGQYIDAIAIRTNTGRPIYYRVHLRNEKKWLDWVNGCDLKDSKNGYAGTFGKAIDAIQIYVK